METGPDKAWIEAAEKRLENSNIEIDQWKQIVKSQNKIIRRYVSREAFFYVIIATMAALCLTCAALALAIVIARA